MKKKLKPVALGFRGDELVLPLRDSLPVGGPLASAAPGLDDPRMGQWPRKQKRQDHAIAFRTQLDEGPTALEENANRNELDVNAADHRQVRVDRLVNRALEARPGGEILGQ